MKIGALSALTRVRQWRLFGRWVFLLLPLGLTHCGAAYEGPKSDHFDGERFHNREPVKKGFWDVLKWTVTRSRSPWPKEVKNSSYDPPPSRVEGDKLRVTFINHATALIQIDGFNILTDPIWSRRCSPVSWAGPARVRAPGLAFEDLPPIHAVLLSHDHYDHLDLPTLKRLEEAFKPTFFAGLGTKALLVKQGMTRVTELDWWASHALNAHTKVVFLPAQHWARRSMSDTNTRLWGSFAITTPHGNIYFAGDTGYGPHFSQIGEKFGPFRLALLPIGAYEPRWFMKQMHMNPDEALQAHSDLRAQQSMGVHFGTFQLTDEAIDEPTKALTRGLAARGIPTESFWAMDFGEGRDVPLPGPEKRDD